MDGDVLDPVAVEAEHHTALQVEVELYRCTMACLAPRMASVGALDEMVAGLGEDLITTSSGIRPSSIS